MGMGRGKGSVRCGGEWSTFERLRKTREVRSPHHSLKKLLKKTKGRTREHNFLLFTFLYFKRLKEIASETRPCPLGA